MPYSDVNELPDAVKNNLPPNAQRMWMHVFNSSLAGRCKGDDGCAAKAAWGVINNHYHKGKDGKWVANKSVIVEFSLAITKASFDPKTQERRFVATASDTDLDSYGEAMSLELFSDFIDRAKKKERPPEQYCSSYWSGGMPYLSVAHYFDLDGKGAVGEVSDIYIDGKQLKAKGKFMNTPLGIAAYEAVKKSINQKADTPDDTQKKIRISIAFLDYGHQHGMNPPYFRKSGTNVRCPYCARGENDVKYLRGHLIHLALTRVPVNTRTDIIGGEVERSMSQIQTRKDDAASIVGEELAEELEKESVLVGKSETEDQLVIKADEESVEEVVEESVSENAPEDDEAEINEDDFIDILVGDDPESDVEEIEDAISKRPDVNPKEGKKKYGDVTFADEKNKKYPIDTEGHIRAAWNYINKPKNAGKYSASEVATIKRKIIAAWKKKIDPAGPPSVSKKSEVEEEVEMADPVDSILAKLSEIDQKLSELKPAVPAQLEEVKEESAYPELQASFEDFMKIFSESVDQGLQGETLLKQVQAPFEQFGATIRECALSLSKVEPESAEKSAIGLEDLRRVVAEAVQPLQNEIALVKQQVSAVTAARTVQDSAPVQPIRPTPRGMTGATIQNNPIVLQSLQSQSKPRDPNKPLSLREIAERSANAK